MASKPSNLAIKDASKARAVLAKHFGSKKYKRRAFVAASTNPIELERKRKELQRMIDQISFLCEGIFAKDTSEEERSKLFNMANLVMMQGFLASQGTAFDANTIRIPCTLKDENGVRQKDFKRRGIADLLASKDDDGKIYGAADILADISDAMDVQIKLMLDVFFPMMNDVGTHYEIWKDRHGTPSPNKYTDVINDLLAEDEDGILGGGGPPEDEPEQAPPKKPTKPMSVDAIEEELTGKPKGDSNDDGPPSDG